MDSTLAQTHAFIENLKIENSNVAGDLDIIVTELKSDTDAEIQEKKLYMRYI